MLNNFDVALYYLSKDPENKMFNRKLIERNNRRFYEGNARLNKYMQLAQNVYIAMYNELLIDTKFYAYDNGAVDIDVQKNYDSLLSMAHSKPSYGETIPEKQIEFLDAIYELLEDASIDELIELSHEDPSWIEKHNYYYKEDQLMNQVEKAEQYRKQYSNVIRLLERML